MTGVLIVAGDLEGARRQMPARSGRGYTSGSTAEITTALHFAAMDPAELSPGEFFCRMLREVERNKVRVIVIDSLNGLLNAMPGETDPLLQMRELLAYLNQKGAATFLILTRQGLVRTMPVPRDISYLLLLSYFESAIEFYVVGNTCRRPIAAIDRTTASPTDCTMWTGASTVAA